MGEFPVYEVGIKYNNFLPSLLDILGTVAVYYTYSDNYAT
jgi:hypothetical protein